MFGRKSRDMPVRSAPDDASLPLIDAVGDDFETLRAMDLGHSFWRTQASTDLSKIPSGQIIVLAAYTPDDISRARPLMGRFMTIVLGMGLGPQYGSRALQLGAMAYLDGGRDRTVVRGLFSDAVARVHLRRIRERAGAAATLH
jgi:hypothetical protein